MHVMYIIYACDAYSTSCDQLPPGFHPTASYLDGMGFKLTPLKIKVCRKRLKGHAKKNNNTQYTTTADRSESLQTM